jgi:hypothetical protein
MAAKNRALRLHIQRTYHRSGDACEGRWKNNRPTLGFWLHHFELNASSIKGNWENRNLVSSSGEMAPLSLIHGILQNSSSQKTASGGVSHTSTSPRLHTESSSVNGGWWLFLATFSRIGEEKVATVSRLFFFSFVATFDNFSNK